MADLYRGPVPAGSESELQFPSLDEKLRQAYFWIVNNAIISPHYDIEYNDGPPQTYIVGDSKRVLTLPSAQSYSSFILLSLLSLLTFATRKKCLFIGGPGRGKTASAILPRRRSIGPVSKSARSRYRNRCGGESSFLPASLNCLRWPADSSNI